MAYSLTTAITELKRVELWHEEAVVYEPLEGTVDGSNTIFYTQQCPISSSDGITVYDASGNTISSGSYTVESYAAGSVRFDTAPSVIYYASYTAQTLDDTALTNVVKAGFDKMEAEYNRNWYLTSDQISSSSSSVVDPVTGSYTFSTSRLQVRLYLLCCEYELVKAKAKYAAANYFRYRESRTGGVQVDRTQAARDLMALLDIIQKDIDDVVVACANQSGDNPWGVYVPGAKSDIFLDQYDWVTDSRQDRGEVA